MTLTQSDKATQFRALHEAPGAFVIANVWDGGSARMMAGLGFAALATSSGASAGLLTGLLSAAKEGREHGTFGYIDTSLATPDMNAFLRE